LAWILKRIANTDSRELFILAVIGLALGTAFAAAELFGVSLALGAFLAGVVIGESDISHQVGIEIIPFRDVFAVLFFVSVGMLVNPASVVNNIGPILMLTVLIMVGKAVITLLLGLLLPAPIRTFVVVAAGLSQIGKFSFILGQAGVSLKVLTQEQYGLILASAVLSIILNPLMYKLIPLVEGPLQKFPKLGQRMEQHTATENPPIE
jgi:CPA2 family monovalent cation:H+ antiporter-2